MKDYFSRQASHYAQNRPVYPEELFTHLSSLCEHHGLVWDVATGNGQAALALSTYFERVVATDISFQQLSYSIPKSNITYRQEPAENSSLPDLSADLVTVATAAHWFDLPAFYEEVNRVLKPGGVLAVWGYGGCKINEGIDRVVEQLSFGILLDYWPVETRLNWVDKYRSLMFPFNIIEMPVFKAFAHKSLSDFISYMNSWSGVEQYKQNHNSNPIDMILPELEKEWGNPEEKREITWELYMKCGYKPSAGA